MPPLAPLRLRLMIAALAAPVALPTFAFAQTNGQWTLNNSGTWSTSGSWLDGNIADGTGSIADFSQLNITTDRTVTIDGAVASRTLGTLLFGDIDSSHKYTIGASGGGTLTFDNGGSTAAITQGANSGANVISAPVLLADSLNIGNNSASLFTISTGGISASTAGVKTITNQGSGTGGVTLGGVIGNGSGSVAIVQNSATSTLTLSGANTFDTGVEIKQGTLLANNAAALGTGTVLLGDTTGSANATLSIGSVTVANNITVRAGSTGTLTIMGNGGSAARPTGDILLDNDVTLEVTANASGRNTGSFLQTTGTISGTGDLNINVSGGLSTSNNTNAPQMDSLTVSGAVTTTGAVNNVGTGEGRAIISGVINNASSLNQNSATSMLTLNAANTYSGATNVNAGVLRSAVAGGLSVNSAVTVASGASLQLNTTQTTTQTLTLSGSGTSYSNGALVATNNAAYAGAIVLADDATVSSTLGNTSLTLSGGITGAGRTLTTDGTANVAISGVIDTGSGGLIKEGSGILTLSAPTGNTFTGVTRINAGTLALGGTNALGGGGEITFNGGNLRHSGSNTVDYSGRIVNSTGPVAIDTNSQNVTYAGNIAASNTGGLSKLGSGRLTLSGTNAFAGPLAVNGGVLAVSTASAIPSTGTGSLFIDSGGALNSGGAYADVQAWLDSDNISTASTGAIALTGASSEAIDFTGYDNLALGASSNATYSGVITAANSTYRLGGGGGTLTISGVNTLTGSNALVVANGNVTLADANDFSGATTVASNTLTLSFSGTVADSAVTVQPGATLAIISSTSDTPVTRASSVTLNRGTLTVTGNSVGNSTDVITGDLTLGSGGNSVVTLAQANAKNVLLTAGGLEREAGATALIRGTNLGVNSLASQTASSTNLSFTSAPALVGGAGANTTDDGILVGVVGDTTTGGTGFGSTGGLLTYDATNGLRLLDSGEYKTSITDGQTQLDNVRLSKATTGAAITTLATDTTINSLSFQTSGNTGAAITVDGAGKLTLNSGVIYSNSVTATAGNTVSNAIDFNGREGVVLVGGTNNLTLSGVLSNTGGNGLTVYAPGRTVTLSGASANTYTGTTTVNGGTLALNKTTGMDAITGDLVINSGGTVSHSTTNQIADTSNVTVNGGNFNYRTDTINNLAVTNSGSASAAGSNGIAITLNGALTVSDNASFSGGAAGLIAVTGVTTLSNGGSISLSRSQNVNGVYDSVATLGGGLNITHASSGAYTAITIGHGSGLGQSGAKLILGGDVTFTGNSTNTNTVLIDATKGTGRQGVIELTAATPGDRTFNIGDGAAATDLAITAALLDGAGGASGLVKTGAGTLAVFGDNTYTGPTTLSAGTFALGAAHRLADTGQLVMNGGTFATGGFSETLGTLSLTVSSTIDLGSGDSDLAFADSSGIAWGDSLVLNFVNFTDGVDSIRFGLDQDGLEAAQLAMIRINGSAASIDSDGYLGFAAVPEPSAYAAFAGAASLLLALRRRRRVA